MVTSSKRKPSTSPLQILTRNYNWRNGSLRRLAMGALQLDSDLCKQVQELVYQQMDRDRFKYEAGQMAIKSGNPGGYMDARLANAIHEAERNKYELQVRGN